MGDRKSYAVSCALDGYESSRVVHAPTAGKAKYQRYLDLSDIFDDLKITDFRARRVKTLTSVKGSSDEG